MQERAKCAEKLQVEVNSKGDQINALKNEVTSKDSQIEQYKRKLKVSQDCKMMQGLCCRIVLLLLHT